MSELRETLPAEASALPDAADGALQSLPVKERLILGGIEEMERTGIPDLSLRRIAKACGVSCAAPYKHFRDKQDFVLGIIRYINRKWLAVQEEIMALYSGDRRRQILEVCMGYVRFLIDNPHFCAIIVMAPKSSDPEQLSARSELSASIKQLVRDYSEELGLDERVTVQRMFVVRSLIYGAAMFVENRQLTDDADTMAMIRSAIVRELEPAEPQPC